MSHPNAPLGSPRVRSTEEQSTFITDHLALAAFLASRGYPASLVAMRSGKVLFRFASTPQLNAAVVAFNDGAAQVDPVAYDAARIQLRRQMDSALGGAR
jgi:hypothetical protein